MQRFRLTGKKIALYVSLRTHLVTVPGNLCYVTGTREIAYEKRDLNGKKWFASGCRQMLQLGPENAENLAHQVRG